MKGSHAQIVAVAAAFCLALGAGCTEDKPLRVQAQYDVTHLGSTNTVAFLPGTLGDNTKDYRGYCRVADRDGQLHINVLVMRGNADGLMFDTLRWTDGAGGCVSCNSVEITYENNVADDIPCCGDGDGLCDIQVRRGDPEIDEPKGSLVFAFSCENVDTNTSSGGVPVPITVRNGRMLIENCSGL